MKLFLDDVRLPPEGEGWMVFRPDTYSMAMFYHLARHADQISFDHDLGLDPDGKEYPSGYDVLSKLENMAHEKFIWSAGAPILTVHSANPVGAQRMRAVIERIMAICGTKQFFGKE